MELKTSSPQKRLNMDKQDGHDKELKRESITGNVIREGFASGPPTKRHVRAVPTLIRVSNMGTQDIQKFFFRFLIPPFYPVYPAHPCS
jgi:hypothetical protein